MLLRAHVPTFPHPPPTLLFPHPPPYTPREYTAVCLQQRYRTMAPSNVALLLCCVLALASIGLGCVRASVLVLDCKKNIAPFYCHLLLGGVCSNDSSHCISCGLGNQIGSVLRPYIRP